MAIVPSSFDTKTRTLDGAINATTAGFYEATKRKQSDRVF